MEIGRVLVLVPQVFFLLLDIGLLVGKIIHSVVEELYRMVRPREEKELGGEVAVVTGAGNGIGRDLARQLAFLGVRVACWDINKEGAEKTVLELEKAGGQAMAVEVDVSDREAVRNAAMMTRSQMGEVTLLFNNAGIMPCKPMFNYTEQEIKKIFAVNVYSQYWTLMEFLPRMISNNKGHIVAMSSMAGVTGSPYLVPYCSSKFAVKGLMDALFLEMRATRPDSKISMTTIHPFFVDTGLAQKPRSRFQKLIPITKPEDVAKMIISAMRRNQEYAFIPDCLCMLTALTKCFPRAGQLAIIDFIDCACDPHED